MASQREVERTLRDGEVPRLCEDDGTVVVMMAQMRIVAIAIAMMGTS
jgi:hypothetical protein